MASIISTSFLKWESYIKKVEEYVGVVPLSHWLHVNNECRHILHKLYKIKEIPITEKESLIKTIQTFIHRSESESFGAIKAVREKIDQLERAEVILEQKKIKAIMSARKATEIIQKKISIIESELEVIQTTLGQAHAVFNEEQPAPETAILQAQALITQYEERRAILTSELQQNILYLSRVSSTLMEQQLELQNRIKIVRAKHTFLCRS